MRPRRRGYGLGRLAAAAVFGAVAAFWTWTTPADPALWPTAPGEAGVEVQMLDNGFHTDLAVPRAALEARTGPLAEAVRSLPPGDWILIGWGDARFYVDQSPIGDRLPDGARAFFRSGNASVIMLDPTQRDLRDLVAADRRRGLRLSAAGFAAMADHIEASLDLGDGHARIAASRDGDDARFFASHEHFWIGRLCNHWSAGVLHAAGLPVRPFRAITSSEIIATVERAQLDSRATRD
ncbi:DUF2459 domain-containing protein [Brevundimonas sp.]|uniref:DUF2459 domain-containing protein n=1 Tax=Brevundimonas sp. TaxID=1871086 RepID=UPI0018130FD4|nr:DUF2459 domain-containing protein [Brevundimonas sp.]MBA3050734.1 DUF2459 domain-containing protein [Brevundimonas sp.]